MKIVTGHKGFIGGRLKARLEAEGEEVVGIELDEWMGDSPESLGSLVGRCDGVYHMGANSSTTYSHPDIFTTNFLPTWSLMKHCKDYDVRMVFASSASVYGNVYGNFSDEGPQNFYAWTKLCSEMIGQSYSGFVSLRYFNVYGPDESHKGNMASVAYQSYEYHRLTGAHFKLFTGGPERDFIYVDDVVDANIHAMTTDDIPFLFYDVGTGKPRTFEVLLTGMGVPYEYYTPRETVERRPNGYQEYTKAEESTFLPGWTPKYSVEEGTKLYREYLDGRV